jgi:glycosyltransferase involved in cell wall biosynthesis
VTNTVGPLRVVHVCQPTDYGVPTVVLNQVTHQLASGWEPVLVCPPDGSLGERARALGVRVHAWPARREPGPSVLSEATRLRALLTEERPDLIHLHSAKAGLVGRLVVRGRRPTVYQPHAWSFHAARGLTQAAALRWERMAARWTERIVCASRAEAVEGRAAGVTGRSVVIPNGADLTRFVPRDDAARRAARARLGVPPDAPLAVCVGRLSPQKAQEVLLAAWPLVRAGLPSARCVLVGDGPDRARLESQLPDGVLLVGRVAGPEDWYAAADVVVLPSRYETNPLAVIEAMSSERCVVVSDVPSVCEPLPAGSTATVPVDDAVRLGKAVLSRLADPVLAASEAADNLRHVRARHDVADSMAALAEVYADVLDGFTDAVPA